MYKSQMSCLHYALAIIDLEAVNFKSEDLNLSKYEKKRIKIDFLLTKGAVIINGNQGAEI